MKETQLFSIYKDILNENGIQVSKLIEKNGLFISGAENKELSVKTKYVYNHMNNINYEQFILDSYACKDMVNLLFINDHLVIMSPPAFDTICDVVIGILNLDETDEDLVEQNLVQISYEVVAKKMDEFIADHIFILGSIKKQMSLLTITPDSEHYINLLHGTAKKYMIPEDFMVEAYECYLGNLPIPLNDLHYAILNVSESFNRFLNKHNFQIDSKDLLGAFTEYFFYKGD